MDKSDNQLEPYEPPAVEDVPLKQEEEMLLKPCKGNGISAGFNTGLTCHVSFGGAPCRAS
jgi:hypothetical protein